jgi:hypothetical protein
MLWEDNVYNLKYLISKYDLCLKYFLSKYLIKIKRVILVKV